jgi:uncharacterized protein YrrD
MNVSDTIFQVDGNTLHFIDVSGLKHHRKSWLAYFDSVDSVLFVASINCYDQYLVEDNSINRMQDALVLFDQTVNHTLLHHIAFVLFLNKKDLFQKKVKKISISKYFPDYKG